MGRLFCVLLLWFIACGVPAQGPTASIPSSESIYVVTRYVSPDGDPHASGERTTHPTTVEHALSYLGERTSLTVQMSAGDFGAWPVGDVFVVPPGSALHFVGSYADVGTGERTIAAIEGGSRHVLVDASNLTAHIGRGARARFTSGTMAGRYVTVRDNDVSRVTLFSAFGNWSPSAGDHFVIERPATHVQWAGSSSYSPVFFSIDEAEVSMSGLYFTNDGISPSALLTFDGVGTARIEGMEFDASASGWPYHIRAQNGATLYAGTFLYLASLRSFYATDSEHGCYFHGSVARYNSTLAAHAEASLHVRNVIGDGFSLVADNDSRVRSEGHDLTSGSVVVGLHSSYEQLWPAYDFASTMYSTQVGRNPAARASIDISNDSYALLDTGTATDVDVAVRVSTHSSVEIAGNPNPTLGFVGARINTVGSMLTSGGRVSVAGAPSITGTLGDCLIGGNAAATPWSMIAAQDVSDLASPLPQDCWAGPEM